VVIWLMNGTQLISSYDLGPPIPLNWTIQGLNAD
jgi:hypothetical protein